MICNYIFVGILSIFCLNRFALAEDLNSAKSTAAEFAQCSAFLALSAQALVNEKPDNQKEIANLRDLRDSFFLSSIALTNQKEASALYRQAIQNEQVEAKAQGPASFWGKSEERMSKCSQLYAAHYQFLAPKVQEFLKSKERTENQTK